MVNFWVRMRVRVPPLVGGGGDSGTDGGTDDRNIGKIIVLGTSTKRSGWERVGVRNVFKSLKGFNDRSLAT